MNLELSLKILGAALWLALVALMQLESGGESWVVLLLMFSPLCLMPLSRRLVEPPQAARKQERSSMAAAVLLGLSFCWQPGLSTALLALPWLGVSLWMALRALGHSARHPSAAIADWTLLASRCFPVVGAAWLVLHRAGWNPLGFDPLIVLLTGTHFHHAGFSLPLIAGLQARRQPGLLARAGCALVLAGVPMVAAGITATHQGWLPWLEPFGVCLMVAGAVCVAVGQCRGFFYQDLGFWPRALLLGSGLSLLVAMILALGFGWRHQLPWAALPMPQMWVIHGSLNVFGFGLMGLLGWRLRDHRCQRS